jgi:hypothetical protein
MPGLPTEILNDDIKELRADFREMRNTMDSLKNDHRELAVGLAEVRTEFRFAKWLLGILLLATISGIGSGIWWAATITANMRVLEAVVFEKSKATEARFDKTDARFDKTDARFDKLESTLAKILEQGKPGSKSPVE